MVKWKINNSNLCNIRGEVETIPHLLYTCRYAQAIWKDIDKILGFHVSLEMLLFGFNIDTNLNFILTVISYAIYKNWLICSFENKPRCDHPHIKMYQSDLIFRRNTYENCNQDFSLICHYLKQIIDFCTMN